MSRDDQIRIRVSKAEKARWVDAAAGNLSAWITRLAEEELSRLALGVKAGEAVSEQPFEPDPGGPIQPPQGGNEANLKSQASAAVPPPSSAVPAAFGVREEGSKFRGADPK